MRESAAKHKTPPLEIRRAHPADAERIAAVLQESFKQYRPLYTDGGYAATALRPDQVLHRMQEGPVWVAILDEQVAGTAAAVNRPAGVYIRGMAALPSARGCGIGEALLREIEEFAAGAGSNRLFLSTTPFLDRAIRLYENFGFRRIADGPHELFGTPLLTMEKRLIRKA